MYSNRYFAAVGTYDSEREVQGADHELAQRVRLRPAICVPLAAAENH